MKRFYRTVAVEPVGDSFGVTLDGKSVRTPARKPLAVRQAALAEAIAAEWDAQGERIRPDTMPLTRLANTAIDRVAEMAASVAAETAKYGETDLLCYRADGPPELAARQAAVWQPLLDWASLRFDAPLLVTAGVLPVEQPPDSRRALANAVAALDPLVLAAVADLTRSCGSLVLALALAEGRIDAETAIEAAFLDETHQTERWGEDAEALDRRRRLEAEIRAAARFLALAVQ
ncbi:MAG TPA: ATP12 family protein [Stellaceae bacterium]|nr:ATP12 family protein [Stellaceae bacterium]